MDAKERVMRVIRHQKPDRMPCFGASSTVTYQQMEKAKAFWPEGHEKAEAMAKQAMAAYTVLGFDAVRVPFWQGTEAEALGCKIKHQGAKGIPGIDAPPPYKLDDTPEFPGNFLTRGRIPEILKAVQIIKKELGDEVPVIGGIIGPFTLASHLLDTVPTLKASMKFPEKLIPFLDMAERAGTILARALVDEGVDIIACEDMASSPQLVHPKFYHDYGMKYQAKQFAAISVPKILHICGNVNLIAKWMGKTGAEILSIEPDASIEVVRENCTEDKILMGGVDTSKTLFEGDVIQVKSQCEASIASGIQILAPGCAVAPGTPTDNLLAIVEVAKYH